MGINLAHSGEARAPWGQALAAEGSCQLAQFTLTNVEFGKGRAGSSWRGRCVCENALHSQSTIYVEELKASHMFGECGNFEVDESVK